MQHSNNVIYFLNKTIFNDLASENVAVYTHEIPLFVCLFLVIWGATDNGHCGESIVEISSPQGPGKFCVNESFRNCFLKFLMSKPWHTKAKNIQKPSLFESWELKACGACTVALRFRVDGESCLAVPSGNGQLQW